MRLYFFLTLTASLCLASNINIVIKKQGPQCGIKGNRISLSLLTTSQPNFLIPAQCGALCKSQPLCQAYAVEAAYCRLYILPIINILTSALPGIKDNTYYDRACATSTDICQSNGFRSSSNQAISTSNKITDNSFKACSALCKKTANCNSYSIELATGGSCRLYRNPLVQDFIPDSSNLKLYWDINCPRAVGDPGPTLAPYVPPVALPSSSITTHASATFPAATTASPLSSDSPAYVPSGPQIEPDDDSVFISQYTYEEYQIPPYKSMGSPPVTTGIVQPTALPSAPCMVQPGPQAPFSVLNENYIPMVSRASNSIGPLLQPTKAPAANDPLLSPETLSLPTFYLQKASGVTGVYDMVYTGSSTPQYVAMTNTGAIVLVGASTGTSFVNNRVTSIFNADCYGRISITQGGSKYTWSTNGATSTLVKAATPANNMKALPKNIPAVQSARKHRKRNQELAERLIKRGSYTDGPAPKCSPSPPNLVARTKQGYKLGQGNFCDSLSDKWSYSPFSFDGSCAVQSLCYDQCEDFGWQSCNGIFGTLMILSCLDAFESWWEVIPAVACAAQAAYFTGVAATSSGRELFYNAQGAMCRCFCSSPPDTCEFPDHTFYCANIHGTDESNCGNCGTICGPNSRCHDGGKCGCPRDSCGQTCLDFRNNPHNCGSCGNACNPAYCLDGRCYAPQPGDCIPDQSVTNNDFATYSPNFVNWTMLAYDTCTLGDTIKFSPTKYLFNGGSDPAILISMTNLPSQGCLAALAQAQVKMCPGIQYEFTFAMGYVSIVNNDPVVSNAECTVRWVTGTPDVWTSNGNFQYSDTYHMGPSSNPYYKTFGPWSFHVAKGDPGVTKSHKQLYINLTAVINCGGATNGAGRFVIRDIQLNQVGSVQKRSLTIGEKVELRGMSVSNVTEDLEPYYPDQKVLITSATKNSAKRRESIA